jgi:hypothetical protein
VRTAHEANDIEPNPPTTLAGINSVNLFMCGVLVVGAAISFAFGAYVVGGVVAVVAVVVWLIARHEAKTKAEEGDNYWDA